MPPSARARALCAACLSLVALASLTPSQARAWAHAQVAHVAAKVDLTRETGTRVELRIGVTVTGGWLSTFEITGLSPDFTLPAEAPATILAADGATYSPTATRTEAGVLLLELPDRAQAPRRGQHTVVVTYDTQAPQREAAAAHAGMTRLRLGLPRWDVSLSDVRVLVVAPAGAALAPQPETATLFDATHALDTTAGTREITLTRATLPRGQSFEVAIDVPRSADPGSTHPPSRSPLPIGMWLGLCIALLAGLKRTLVRRQARREQLTVMALVPMRQEAMRGVLILAACLAGGAVERSFPVAATLLWMLGVALALDLNMVRTPRPEGARERDATGEDLQAQMPKRARELFSAAAWLDATTPPGLCLLALLHAAPWLAADGVHSSFTYAALAVTPLYLTATRLSRPLRVPALLHHLSTLRSDLSSLSAYTQLRVSVGPAGDLLQAQLRLVPWRIPAGMGKLELRVAEGFVHGRPRWTLCWHAQCRADSPADALLSEAMPLATREVDAAGHVHRTSITLDVHADAEHLLGWLRHATLSQAA